MTAAATVVPVVDGPPAEVPRRIGGLGRSDAFAVVGAAASGLGVAVLLFGPAAPLGGGLGFCLVAYVVFVLAYGLLVSMGERGPATADKVVTVVLGSAAALTFGALLCVIAFTVLRGRAALGHANFFTQDMARAGPLDPLTVGGVAHALLGTLWTIAIALVVVVPLGLTGAVYLNEIGGRLSRFVRTIVDAMTALPSIVAGLFVYAVFILALHGEKSGLAAALAIGIMMLPIVIRAADIVLRLVPGNLREASAALGASQWRTVWHVVLPTARSGLATAVILGTARGIGETAPVLLTAGFTAALNANPVRGPMISLPLAAFEFVKSPQPTMIARGFAAAAFLMLVVICLFAVARVLGGHGPGHLSRRQARRRRRASARDAERFAARHGRPVPVPTGGLPCAD